MKNNITSRVLANKNLFKDLIFAVLPVFSSSILALVIFWGLFVYTDFTLYIKVFSDFGIHPQIAIVFNMILFTKGLIDCVFVLKLIGWLRIKNWFWRIFCLVPMISFSLLGIFPKDPLRSVHWTFVIIYIISLLIFQIYASRRLKNDEFSRTTNFVIIMEIAFVTLIFINRMLWGVGEILVMGLIVFWFFRLGGYIIRKIYS